MELEELVCIKNFSKIDLKVEVGNYNGIVIGPSSKIFNFISIY